MDPTLKSKTISKLKDEIEHLSPQLRTAAKYVIDNPADFGLDPIRETSRKSGVSTYTLVRTAHRLGFSSYEEFREPFRHALVSTSEFIQEPAWVDELRESGDIGRVQAEATRNAMSIVQRSLERQSTDELKEVVDTLLAARNVYLTAVRSSYAMAYYFHYVGRMALTSLQLIPRNMNSAIDELNYAGPGDVLIAITITPYSRETIQACEFARKKGVKLILITDSDIVSPELKPEYVLVTSVISTHHFGCFTGMLATLELLLALLVSRGGDAARERIKSYEDLRAENNAYWVRKKNISF
ncbi:MAG: MurR/RpiR family transcriptional regulator [Paracoccaceae bacterium]|nr:MurR/RpiR family transcriptional regulator [Paracoccaceae bacterium]MBT6543517.1 MurR/RpiR family transcriptional regulator [Paracoccaceae bacterium]